MKPRSLRNKALVEAVLAHARTLPDRAADATCPAAGDFDAFLRGEWEYERARGLLRHVLDCDACTARMPGDHPHPDEAVSVVVPATDEVTRAAVLAFLLDLAAIGAVAARRRSSLQRRGGRGVPRSAARMVVAQLYDRDGNLMVGADAQSRTVSFEVELAEINDRRGIAVRVSTTDRSFACPDGPAASVRIALRAGARMIALAPAELRFRGEDAAYPSAAASVRSPTGVATGQLEIPVDAIEITVVLP